MQQPMKSLVKLIIVGVFMLGAAALLFNTAAVSNFGSPAFAGSPSAVIAQQTPTPRPTANTAINSANIAANAMNSVTNAMVNASKPAAGDKTIPKEFTLGKDSLSEYGEVPFNHDTHAFKNYSPDGKAVVGCAECHHTDQPKSALKPPLVTSERDVILTMASWRASNQKVNECRFCHFQDGSVPDDKVMPTASYTDAGKTVSKDLNNELAYHINCNTCHDAAVKIRPELKTRAGFAASKDCTICHKSN
ncbi:MAG: cytochrome c3 family protein [Saprospiraceae bacterium]|nr:cytochrome c3 family protein [Pyrinomonadaceae bacterium]